jgi:hypothetical protein
MSLYVCLRPGQYAHPFLWQDLRLKAKNSILRS